MDTLESLSTLHCIFVVVFLHIILQINYTIVESIQLIYAPFFLYFFSYVDMDPCGLIQIKRLIDGYPYTGCFNVAVNGIFSLQHRPPVTHTVSPRNVFLDFSCTSSFFLVRRFPSLSFRATD